LLNDASAQAITVPATANRPAFGRLNRVKRAFELSLKEDQVTKKPAQRMRVEKIDE
jgi:hypothetical protein